tara:strand:+ start:1753 stop:1881 length:129 start_codon:yes stop_codon:yes gene_type:complete
MKSNPTALELVKEYEGEADWPQQSWLRSNTLFKAIDNTVNKS